jgi:hypothetical protein
MKCFLVILLLVAPFSLTSQQASPSSDIRNIVSQYPLTKGSSWTYTTVEDVEKDSLKCGARGTSVTTIVSVQDGSAARIAKAQVNATVTTVTGDEGCRSRFANSNLDWTYVIVSGKVYGAPLFNEELLTRALSEGQVPFAERGIAPLYVFPLQAGSTWTGTYDKYEVRQNDSVKTLAGDFDNCFKIIQVDKETPERRNEDIVCSGVGLVSMNSSKPGHIFGSILTAYSVGK